jgi:selenocysteine-specific elongation factor
VIIGTAGHIDHGKSALVEALSGRKMDRLAEERRRGITIDLNFAPLEFPDLPPAGIVDVPGHEDFVRTMVAGASGIDLVLLVVDGSQGPQPQTWEHLAIVEQLRIPLGIPVITKADLADPEWLELLAEDLAVQLAGSPVRFEAPCVVSAVTGLGIAGLLARLAEHCRTHTPDTTPDAFRMPVDRAFSIAGVGTVVTGTPWSGALRVGDTVRILPGEQTARVRSLEAYGREATSIGPGSRAAIGLAGVERIAVGRGMNVLTGPVPWRVTTALDTEVELLPGTAAVKRRLRVRLHLGTAEVLGRVYPMEALEPGGRAPARIVLEGPVVARGGDRFVLRSYSPVITIGGGRVLDPLPPRRSARVWPPGLRSTNPGERAAALLQRRSQGAPAGDLALLLGVPDAAARRLAGELDGVTIAGETLISRSVTVRLRAEAITRVSRFHAEVPGEEGLSLETLRSSLKAPASVVEGIVDGLIRRGDLVVTAGVAALPGFSPQPTGNPEEIRRIVAVIAAAGLMPPSTGELEASLGITGVPHLLRLAAKEGSVVRVESERYFSTQVLERFTLTLTQLATQQSITPGAVRDHFGLSRKFVVPLLEWSDREGVTKRVGDIRVLVNRSKAGSLPD